MKYMRRTAGYTWTDHKTNTQIAKELKISQILDKLQEYKRNWIHRVSRMPRNRLPMVMKQFSPIGRRNHGRPLKRLLDAWDRNGSTSGLIPWKIDDNDNDLNAAMSRYVFRKLCVAPKRDVNCACLMKGCKWFAHARGSCAIVHARQPLRDLHVVLPLKVCDRNENWYWSTVSHKPQTCRRLAVLEFCPYGEMDWTVLFGMPGCERA